MIARRTLLALPLLFLAQPSRADEGAWALLGEPGAVILFRHANAPGTGDPAGFRLGDCSTQRNLDERGRAEARAIGEAFRARGIAVGRVLSSQWCRARETAELAFGPDVAEEPAFNSFFGDRAAEPERTVAARAILLGWEGPGVLAAVTHQVNITALTGIVPAPGEGIVLRRRDGLLNLAGRLPPPARH
jgi:hypothetical protein